MALTLLGREHCGLCEEFLEALAAEFPALLPALAIYGLVIPVLLDDEGTVICATRFDAAAVSAALAAERRGAAR
jgi:hypothetical protein